VPSGQAARTTVALPQGLAAPGDAGTALAAQAVGVIGDGTAGALTAVLNGESGYQIRMGQLASHSFG
jgi:hypothetical protein